MIATKTTRKLLALTLTLIAITGGTAALGSDGAPEIIGDRPDFTESAVTAPPIHLQGELGVAYSSIGANEVLSVPNMLLRLGIIRHLELRLGLPTFEASLAGKDTTPDVGGVEVGAKLAFNVGDKGALGLLPFVVLPVYSNQLNQEGISSGIKGLWSVEFNDTFSLGGNIGVIFDGFIPGTIDLTPSLLASLSLGISVTNKVGTFLEVYAIASHIPTFVAVADGGFTFLVAPRLQLDIHAGVGLTPDARGFDAGGGIIFII